MMAGFSFAYPAAFLLLALPPLMRLLSPVASAAGLRVPAHVLASVMPHHGQGSGAFLPALAWIALVAALAGPQISRPSDMIPASGRDIVLAIDLSGSMEREDFDLDGAPLSRLDAVKRVASRLVASREGDRIGLVIFGDRAYFAQPLTFDVAAVARAIDEAQIGISGRSTSISDGLGLAMKRFVASDAPTRVVVLFSDGSDTAANVDAVEVARLAARHGVRIHTVALGPQDMETAPASRDAVDSETLRALAEESGGTTFHVRGLRDLEQMAVALDRLEPNPSARPPMIYHQSLWPWPGGLALLLLQLAWWRRA